jgi:hypothetical protein
LLDRPHSEGEKKGFTQLEDVPADARSSLGKFLIVGKDLLPFATDNGAVRLPDRR